MADRSNKSLQRCHWAKSPLMIKYHDQEWGVPVHNDNKLFEFLVLEGAQAGLSWETILSKRENYRRAFDGFDPTVVARYNARKFQKLMKDAGIVRNRLKIKSAISNAAEVLSIQSEIGSFDRYIWKFVDGIPKKNSRRHPREIPSRTPQSDAMSKDLKRRGFRFIGSTICYAFMQATGMVNDHTLDCFRFREIS
jgi:DNA-3-methyladenine glycosylase I